MTSQRKIEANRRNAQASCGPRSAAGRARSSRNALRHGLSTISSGDPLHNAEIARIAKMICGEGGDDTAVPLLQQAVRIAECDVLLRCIGDEKVAALERLRNPTTLALWRQQRLRRIMPFLKTWQRETELADFEADRLEAIIDAKVDEYGWAGDGSDRLGQGMEWAPVGELHWREVTIASREEFGAMYEAVPDLERLARYERRARSRQRRATLAFIAIKIRQAQVQAQAQAPAQAQAAHGKR